VPSTLTITLPDEVSRALDEAGNDAAKLVADALLHELDRHRQTELERSLEGSSAESAAVVDIGLTDWLAAVPESEAADLLDPSMAIPVRWVPGQGWLEGDE
jgi:hypothetical protein